MACLFRIGRWRRDATRATTTMRGPWTPGYSPGRELARCRSHRCPTPDLALHACTTATRAARRPDRAHAGPEHAAAHPVHGAAGPDQTACARGRRAPRLRPRAHRARLGLGRRKQRLDRGGAPGALGRDRRREPAPARLVPGVEQSSDLGRHPGAAAHLPRPHSVPEVLPEAGADLGAGDRSGLVGAGLSVHEARQRPGRAPAAT